MRIVSRKNLRAYAKKHPGTRASLDYWEMMASSSHWKSPGDVIRVFPKASVIDGERIRFEIQSNVHRMICAFYFPHDVVFVKFLGTHAQYDGVDAATVSQF